MEAPVRPQDRLYALDAFRGAAALWVVVYHLTLRYPNFLLGQDTPLEPIGFGITLQDLGIIPVLWFFLISGFVISWTIDRCATPMDFVISRVSRIYPAYWASLAIIVGAVALWPLPNVALQPTQVLVNLTMLQNQLFIGNVAGVYWTLGVEVGFYIFALAVFAAGLWRFVHLFALAWVLLAIAVVPLADFGIAFPWRASHLLSLHEAPFLVAGMMLYRLWRGHGRLVSALILGVCVDAMVGSNPLGSVATVLAVMALIGWSCRGGLRFLAAPPLLWLGSISYSLYLVHEYPGYIVMGAADRAGMPHGLGIAAALAIALILATAVSYGIERPAMRLIRNRWRARTLRL